MANKVTNDDILKMNEVYYKVHTYAETARQTGFSASTIKKYIIKDWKPIVKENVKHFTLEELPDFNEELFKGIDNLGVLCELTEEETAEIKELWEELSL